MNSLLERLGKKGISARFTPDEWSELISYLKAELAAVLPDELIFDESPMIQEVSPAFCLEFRTAPRECEETVCFKLSGTLGMQVNGDDPGVPSIVATAFITVNGETVITTTRQSYLELAFDIELSRWTSADWKADEWGGFSDESFV